MTPQERAERSAAVMLESDMATKTLGACLDEIGPGYAVLSMTVRPEHLNGHAICHGGIIYTFADTCFAVACNSYNQKFVSQHGEITYLAPGREGCRLVATACEKSIQGRTGIYDVRVQIRNGQILALFRGLCRAIRGSHFEE